MVALVGLVIDGGLALAGYREAQNAADAAALSAAMDLMLGRTSALAKSNAAMCVTGSAYNNLSGAAVVINIPPSQGSYQGMANYAEAIITCPTTSYFIRVLPGVNRNGSVKARAVAGFEPLALDEGVAALSPTGDPGLRTSSNNATLTVNGRVLVNSTVSHYAAKAGTGKVYSPDVEVVGGVDNPQNFQTSPTNPTSSVHTGVTPTPDLFSHLPTPMVANGVDPTIRTFNANNTSLQPGVYPGGISISGNKQYTMAPGIYVLAGGDLSISGSATLTGQGVMFYVTGNTYVASSGAPDASDPIDPLGQVPPATSGTTFSNVKINSNVQLSPIDTKTYSYGTSSISAFDGMLFYFRRDSTATMTIEGNSSGGNLSGTVYAKWGNLNLAGQGTYLAQFIVGTVDLTGNGAITVSYTGAKIGKAPQVFLVE
jgi:hypothetical protein